MNPTPTFPDTAQVPAPARPVLLCVDDETSILSSLRRLFRAHGYQVLTAESGQAGLELLQTQPVDLVISDMRMPEMDGVVFLEHVRQRHPHILRLLLTGYADVSSIMGAINRGEIYRYISKPWDENDIVLTVQAALERTALEREKKRLEALVLAQNEELKQINASLEQRVLERTAELNQANGALRGANDRLKNNFLTSIKMFTGLIEMRDSKLAGHSRNVADLARRIAHALNLDNREGQEIFVAGLLHAIGKVGFDNELLSTPLDSMSPRQLDQYRKHPARAEQLLMALGELKGAVEIIGAQLERHDGSGYPHGVAGRSIPMGARILALARDYCGLLVGRLESRPYTRTQAREYILQHRGHRYDPMVVDAFATLTFSDELSNANALPPGTHKLQSKDFKPGMVLARDLSSPSGLLLLTTGHVLDEAVIGKIRSFERSIGAKLTAELREPPTEVGSDASSTGS